MWGYIYRISEIDVLENEVTKYEWHLGLHWHIEEKENGYYRIVGRKSKIINVGGEKVLPIEVETVILDLNYILDCTVYAKDNPITGQVVGVKVVVKSMDIDLKQLKKSIKLHCKKNLERYKVPAEIIISDKIDYSTRFKKTLD